MLGQHGLYVHRFAPCLLDDRRSLTPPDEEVVSFDGDLPLVVLGLGRLLAPLERRTSVDDAMPRPDSREFSTHVGV